MRRNNILFFIILLLASACMKNDYEIEYQPDYPNDLADNWIAFEFQGGDIDGNMEGYYNLVTSLDPNRDGCLIIDKLYNSDVRVRADYIDSSFSVVMGEQLERISTHNYGIEYISVEGYVTSNPVPRNIAFQAATLFLENMTFLESDIEDVIFLRAGLYDSAQAPIDTILIIGYRKTGFENVEY